MRAAVLSIGDELVAGATRDTNAPWIADQLTERAVSVVERRTLGDDRERIARALSELGASVDLILTTGGLGPTDDDLTREAVGDAVAPGQPLVRDDHAMRVLERRYALAKRRMPQSNRRQAMRPESTVCLNNPHGTAPGLHACLEQPDHRCEIFVLPGPPGEMKPMFERFVFPVLPCGEGSESSVRRLVHACGLSESEAAERLGDLLARGRNPLVGITVSRSILTARIRGVGSLQEMEHAVAQVAATVEERWASYVFGCDETTLAASIVRLLADRRQTVATAESCTGGGVGSMIVSVPGSSVAYRGGWITYSNQMKQDQLGVPKAIIESHGAVSGDVAMAMATGALQSSGADYALSITGIAGPDGGSDAKPVGTVFIGLAGQDATPRWRQFRFPGDRSLVQDRTIKAALQYLRFCVLGLDEAPPLLWQRSEYAGD